MGYDTRWIPYHTRIAVWCIGIILTYVHCVCWPSMAELIYSHMIYHCSYAYQYAIMGAWRIPMML